MASTQTRALALGIAGFRSLYDTYWWPGDLNVVIGPNGSGKSNLLRALELLSTAAKGQLSAAVQEQGGMEALTWDGQHGGLSFSLITREAAPPMDDEDRAVVWQQPDAPEPFLRYLLGVNRLGRSGHFRIIERGI